MTDPKPNMPLLRRVLEHIDTFPQQWDQSTFTRETTTCGTTHCVGGWTNALVYGEGVLAELERDRYWGEDDLAEELLGLTKSEAHALFYTTMTPSAILTPAECSAVEDSYDVENSVVPPTYGTIKRTLERAAVQKVCEQIATRAGEAL